MVKPASRTWIAVLPGALAAAGAGLLPLLLTGCVSLAPKYQRPAAPVPAAWPTGAAYGGPDAGTGSAAAAPAGAATTDAAVAGIPWRAFFKDPRLRQVIAQGLADSRTLRQSVAAIEAARQQYRVTRAASLPQLSADISGNGSRSLAVFPGFPNSAYESKTYSASIGLSSWEIDLFGRQHSLNEAAFENYLESAEAARATRISLISEIASAWLAYAADNAQRAIARQTEDSARASMDVTRRRLDNGVASRVDLAQAETLYQTARNDLATLTTSVAQDRNALELLVGGPVDASLLPTELPAGDSLAAVPAGLSSAALLDRPDVRQAEHALKAANFDIGAARAAFFPSLSLTANGGLESTALSTLFSGGTNVWTLAPQLALPLFNGGANVANLALSKAQKQEAVAAYELAVQSGFREVADALAVRGTIQERLAAQQALVDASGDSYRLADARYQKGVDTYLTSLDSQRTLYSAQRTLVTTRQAALDNEITLYRALGGGLVE